jgi:hypothetical protein
MRSSSASESDIRFIEPDFEVEIKKSETNKDYPGTPEHSEYLI